MQNRRTIYAWAASGLWGLADQVFPSHSAWEALSLGHLDTFSLHYIGGFRAWPDGYLLSALHEWLWEFPAKHFLLMLHRRIWGQLATVWGPKHLL